MKKREKESSFEKKVNKLFAKKGLQPPSVFFYEETDSTNTRAKLFAEDNVSGTRCPAIFFTHAQYAGRGTRGRTFESPVGGGVYISFLIFPQTDAKLSLSLTTYTACCVLRTLKKLSKNFLPKIKWVNDITVNDLKLCGILTEGKIEDGLTKYAIVGIGINVNNAIYSPEVSAIMTSLKECGVRVSRDKLALLLAEEFFGGLSDIGSEKILNEYKEASSIIDREIEIHFEDKVTIERAIDIDSDFSLITKTKDGKINKYVSADVSVRISKDV